MSIWILCRGVLLGKSHCSAGSELGGEAALLTGTCEEPLCRSRGLGALALSILQNFWTIINKQRIHPRGSPSTRSPPLQEQSGKDTTQSRPLPGVSGVGSSERPSRGTSALLVPAMGGGSFASPESIFAVCQQVSVGISPAPLLALPVILSLLK